MKNKIPQRKPNKSMTPKEIMIKAGYKKTDKEKTFLEALIK